MKKGNFTVLSDNDIEEIVRLYSKEKVSLTNLKKQFKISDKRIKQILEDHNIHIRSHRESRLIYEYNENYFNTIDTPEKAYWLGFIYADGFITKRTHGNHVFGITLAEKEPLEKLNKCMNSNKKIGEYIHTTGFSTGTNKEYKLAFCSPQLVSDLEKWGCVERKTFKLKFPHFLSKDLIPHFVRGFFDGDGSVFLHIQKNYGKEYVNLGITICGTEEYLKDFAKACNLPENIVYKDHRKQTDCWSIKLASNIRCLTMYHFMYKNAGDLCLSRKRQKFEDFIKERGSTTIIDNLNRENKADYLKLCYLED